MNSDIEKVKEILIRLDNIGVDGIFFYDIGMFFCIIKNLPA